MNTIHIITEKEAAEKLQTVLASEVSEFLVLQDFLNVGPLREEGLSFSQTRTRFRNTILDESNNSPVDDLEGLMAVSTQLSNFADRQLYFWMAANAADVCAYFWLLHYLKKHAGRLSVINTAGLPFLNEEQQLFYPTQIAQLPQKELIKALKLKRTISISEWETDTETWPKFLEENAPVRVLKEGKNIEGKPDFFFDSVLENCCRSDFKKVTTLLQHARQELQYQAPNEFLAYRLRVLEKEGKIILPKSKTVPEEEEKPCV